MNISRKDWLNYVGQLKAISDQAGVLMENYIARYGFSNMQALINYAFALTQAYGEAAAAISVEMYDAVAQVSKKYLPPAEPADTPSFGEVAKTMNGIHKTSENLGEYGGAVGRMVKRTGADTTLNNALRDGAEFAWIPNGDTCSYCTMLASRGWQKISEKALKNGHAEHIHSNCDCTYAIRFNGQPEYENYDPVKYLEQYYGAEGNTPQERLNYMRRQQYAENPEKYRLQKRINYLSHKSYINSEMRDVTKSFFDVASPGFGEVSEEKGFREVNGETEIAQWLHDMFGGDIVKLSEKNPEGECNPDFQWNGKLWDLKKPTSKNENTLENRIKYGIKQISKNPGGIIMDITNSRASIDQVDSVIRKIASKKAKQGTMFIIKNANIVRILKI